MLFSRNIQLLSVNKNLYFHMSLVIFSGRDQISCDLLKKYFSGEIYDSKESKIVIGNEYKTTDILSQINLA